MSVLVKVVYVIDRRSKSAIMGNTAKGGSVLMESVLEIQLQHSFCEG